MAPTQREGETALHKPSPQVNYIMWWCFLKGMWKAVRGRLGLRKIVFKVTEKKGDGSKKREAVVEKKKAKSARSDQDGLLDGEEQKGPSGYTDAEVMGGKGGGIHRCGGDGGGRERDRLALRG